MSIPESMKQITEAAERLIAPADVQGSVILSEEQLKKQGQCIIFQNDAPDKTELVLGDEFEVKVENGKTFVVRKQPSYPKTYKECCKVLGLCTMDNDVQGFRWELIIRFQELLIARDAYWKLAGDWKPDWKIDVWNDMYYISFDGVTIAKETGFPCCNMILIFPTEEMRDTFYENFKDLIEECKELL